MFEIIDVDKQKLAKEFEAPKEVQQPKPQLTEGQLKAQRIEQNLRYVSDKPGENPVRAPGTVQSIRVSPDAPAPAKGMIGAIRLGDKELASQYADDLIVMQKNYFFEVREITQLIGEALVRQKVIEDEDWIGAEQQMEIEMAKTRHQMGELLKPDHDTAMERVKPDPKNQAEIFYFFSMNCSWCRMMAPNVERLWRVAKNDPNVKMATFVIGKTDPAHLKLYREYTGLTAPILDGEEMGKKFNIRYVPTIVIVSPNGNRAYRKTGQQNFARMYQFLRTVQGVPATVTAQVERLVDTPIGEVELKQAANVQVAKKRGTQRGKRARLVRTAEPRQRQELERF